MCSDSHLFGRSEELVVLSLGWLLACFVVLDQGSDELACHRLQATIKHTDVFALFDSFPFALDLKGLIYQVDVLEGVSQLLTLRG